MKKVQTGKTALVIMAAGIGSRFGQGIKQLEPVGRHDEIIMDYSVHDAIEAGFDKIVYIIRKDIKEAFSRRIGAPIDHLCQRLGIEVVYAYQELEDLPEGFAVPEGRKKPWGTGQAVLACRELLKEPFAVINADDYYGKEAFLKMYRFLQENRHKEASYCFAMAGFILKNTLSENGGVTRGICSVDETGYLTGIQETPDIRMTPQGIVSGEAVLDPESYVSMNMWGFLPGFLPLLEEGFREFLQKPGAEPEKCEFLIPIYMGKLLQERRVSVRVLETRDRWFGVTYREDKDAVAEAFEKLIEDGIYADVLFSDL